MLDRMLRVLSVFDRKNELFLENREKRLNYMKHMYNIASCE